jgi:hypothetical protein
MTQLNFYMITVWLKSIIQPFRLNKEKKSINISNDCNNLNKAVFNS